MCSGNAATSERGMREQRAIVVYSGGSEVLEKVVVNRDRARCTFCGTEYHAAIVEQLRGLFFAVADEKDRERESRESEGQV